jgi:hypothetical protein
MYSGPQQQRDARVIVELQGSRTDNDSSDFVELLAGTDNYKYLGKYLP